MRSSRGLRSRASALPEVGSSQSIVAAEDSIGWCPDNPAAPGCVAAPVRRLIQGSPPGRALGDRQLKGRQNLHVAIAEPESTRVTHLIPAALTALRALLAPVLLLNTHFGASRLLFGICLTVGFLSDIFDGILARQLKIATPGLRRLDSAADTVFYLAALYSVWRLDPQAITSRIAALSVLVVLELTRYAFDWIKFRREASYHMWSSKAWGIMLFVAFFALLACASDNATMTFAIYLGIAADIEGLGISAVLPQWRADVPTLLHAIALRRLALKDRVPIGHE
jgi:CDP-diacylglycerol--glycerol-3-phosphate 3-phosphatidyltransferase